jgi:hypothetical protein
MAKLEGGEAMIDMSPGSKYYTGRRIPDGVEVALVTYTENGGKTTDYVMPDASRKVADHSSEFNWGYGGSGPAQLSLGILLDFTKDESLAQRLAYYFKEDFVATWKGRGWHLKTTDLENWIKYIRKKEDI